MKNRPILMSAPMVRAILDGRKTQTRRAIKKMPDTLPGWWKAMHWASAGHFIKGAVQHCPYGTPGDRLWVRENGWERPFRTRHMMREGADTWAKYYYDADLTTSDGADIDWLREHKFIRRPSIHMPRWASRLTLEVLAVRVERLQRISQDDVFAEGVQIPVSECGNPMLAIAGPGIQPSKFLNGVEEINDTDKFIRAHYAALWENINGPGAWDANPWVWVVEFRRA